MISVYFGEITREFGSLKYCNFLRPYWILDCGRLIIAIHEVRAIIENQVNFLFYMVIAEVIALLLSVVWAIICRN